MTAILILNILFATLVVVGILALLGWGIASERNHIAALSGRRRPVSPRNARRRSRRTAAALDAGA